MEKPTTDDMGNDGLEVEGPASPAAWRSNDANDLLRTGGAAAGAGADGDTGAAAGVGAVEADASTGGVGTVVSREGVGTTAAGSVTSAGGTSWVVMGATPAVVGSHDSDLDFTCECAVPAAETEVLEERGETGTGGVSDTVETSVSEEATVSGKSCRGDSAGSETSLGGSSGAAVVDEGSGGAAAVALGGVAKGATTVGFGDSGGVESLRALSRMSDGGRERGEMMIPGARDGSVGRRDHIAQPPNCCIEFDDLICIFVDGEVEAGVGAGAGAGAGASAGTAGAGTWGVDSGDLETWPEQEGGSNGGGADCGEEEEFGAGAFGEGSGEGSSGGSEGSVDSSVGSGSSGPSSILGGFGEGEIGDNAGGGGMDSCFGKGDINC